MEAEVSLNFRNSSPPSECPEEASDIVGALEDPPNEQHAADNAARRR